MNTGYIIHTPEQAICSGVVGQHKIDPMVIQTCAPGPGAICNTSSGEAETEDPWNALVSQASWIGQLRV